MYADPTLLLSSVMFCVGLLLVLTKKKWLMVLIGAEVLLQAALINLVHFDGRYPPPEPLGTNGQLFALFVIPIATMQLAIALAMILALHRQKK